jgi:hypothetical protein
METGRGTSTKNSTPPTAGRKNQSDEEILEKLLSMVRRKIQSLDGAVMEQVMEYNIFDFSKQQDKKVFVKMFVKLLDGLQLFFKK